MEATQLDVDIVLGTPASTVWLGRTSDGVLPGLFSARHGRCSRCPVMRYEDEQDPKKPQPVRLMKKGLGGQEAAEAQVPLRKDEDRDHRHVC